MENTTKIKTIGVLTSGGDAPGMNAAIRAVVRSALCKGMNVVGVKHGYSGLLNNDFVDMDFRSVSDILHRGGTVLYTARCLEFKTEAGREIAKKNCIAKGIDGLVVIGGDGSFMGARAFSLMGIPCVGIPATIDNDIASSDYTIGFDTAVNTVVDMVDRLRDTSQSHSRCSVVEVMGRNAGHIALHAGISCGAIAIIVPEIPFDMDKDLISKIKETSKTGKQHFIVLISEGVGNTNETAWYIGQKTGIETRATILGHVQRGGSPTAKERVAASQMGHYAVELLSQGIGNRVVVMQKEQVVDYDIVEALEMRKTIDKDLYKIANEISM